MKAEIYSKPNCPYCVKAKYLLEKHNIEYQEYIISAGFGEELLKENQQYVTREQLLEVAPNAKTVPQIWLEGNYIGGFTELDSFFKESKE